MAIRDSQETPWNAQGGEKRALVQSMFAEIAPVYDRLNGMMSLSLHHRWRRFAASKLNLSHGDAALDVCCGTGDFLAPLRSLVGASGTVVGIDFCPPMLERAKPKATPLCLSVGDACQLPIRSGSFHAVSVGWGIRNVPDIDLAHREIARCLKPGGRFVSIDMARPENPIIRWGANLISGKVLPWLGARFGARKAYTYLPESTLRFASRQELAESMQRAGFTDVNWKNLMLGSVCVHWGVKA